MQEEQQTAALASQLSALLGAQQQAAAAAAAASAPISNPFANYYPIAAAAAPMLGVPRFLPGQTGASPSYPSFIPADQASVVHDSEQPNRPSTRTHHATLAAAIQCSPLC